MFGIVEQLTAGFDSWPPVAQAAALFFSTFVLEDVAAVGAGLLLAAGAMAWPAAFWACFLGIWIGDASLYGLARIAGRSWFDRSSLRRYAEHVERSERWFACRGSSVLVFSRLLPGARLPTYLAAGFLRLPLNRFLAITGMASLVWTVVILVVTQVLGPTVLGWLRMFHRSGWMLLGGVALSWMMVRVAKRRRSRGATGSHGSAPDFRQRLSTSLQRWRRWEFWPPWMFYPPVALYCLWLGVKYRGLTLPTAANPGIFAGGIVGESKIATLRELMESSPEFTADGELIAGAGSCNSRLRRETDATSFREGIEERLTRVKEICKRRGIAYPFVLKPDIGQRGVGVKLIDNEERARDYLRQTSAALLLQRYVPGPHEVGIFYYRFPNEARGHILAITEKVFPVITGDGHSTISELVWRDARARFMADKYLERINGRREEVPGAGETIKLVHAGNHAQGCIFRNGMHLCMPALAERIDAISRKLTGFYIGRYDIRYSSEEDLRNGKNFQIIELNGAASEATSIYDARTSLGAAYRMLFRQWDLVFAIGQANRGVGSATTPLSSVWRTWRAYRREEASYPAAD